MDFNHSLGLVPSDSSDGLGGLIGTAGAIAGGAFGSWFTDNRCSDSKALHGPE